MKDKQVRGLLWNRAETPAALHRALAALGEEHPLAESGPGRPIRFKPSSTPGLLRVRCREAEVSEKSLEERRSAGHDSADAEGGC